MKSTIEITRFKDGTSSEVEDFVAIEEPLEISVNYSAAGESVTRNISVTMRTPGSDEFLACGFLFTEGIINSKTAIISAGPLNYDLNRINVRLQEGIIPHLQQAERNFYTTSSCGVCGKSSIDAIKTVSAFTHVKTKSAVSREVLCSLPEKLKQQQVIFKSTGGLHAAALFKTEGNFISLQEDVGRHNAVDKLIGEALQKGMLPLTEIILLLSGRASFELIQKATMAGVKMVAAIGAPSSLAVELATEAGITLVGFLKAGGFNIYTHPENVQH